METRLLIRTDQVDGSGRLKYTTIAELLEPEWKNFLLVRGQTTFENIRTNLGLNPVVRKSTVEWIKDYFCWDVSFVKTRVELSHTSIIFHQLITVEDIVEEVGKKNEIYHLPVYSLTTLLVLQNEDGRSVMIPDGLRNMLTGKED